MNGTEALTRCVAQRGVAGIEQPGVSLNATPADSAPQLIQLGQAESVRVFNQNRVNAGDIEAAFNDGGAEHHIGFPRIERHHGALKLALGHLAMGHKQFQARQHLA